MKITPAQVHWFRLRRSGLIKLFATPEETAGRLIGVHAQLPPAADLAFCNRTANCTVATLEAARIAGTWRYDRKARGLDVRVSPFARLSRPVAGAVEKQALEVG